MLAVLLLFGAAARAQTPTFSSTAVETGTYGTLYIYDITTTHSSPVTISATGVPTAWMTFTDNGNGTAVLTGIPPAVGNFPITLRVADALLPIFFSEQSVNLDVSKAVLTATVGNTTREYGDPNPTFPISYTGYKFSDDASAIEEFPTAGDNSIVGSTTVGNHSIGLLTLGSDDHYTFSGVAGNLAITPAPLTITAENKSKAYGDANPLFTLAYSVFKNSETATTPGVFSSPAVADAASISETTPVSNPAITVSGGVAANYTITRVSGTLTINKAHLTAVANDNTRPYFAAEPPFTISYIGLKNGELGNVIANPPTIQPGFTQTSNAGTYSIGLQNSTGSDENYDFTGYTAGTMTITKVALTAKANDASRPFGSPNQSFFPITYTGFVSDDDAGDISTAPIAGTGAVPATPVGTASSIDVDIDDAIATNYTFNPVSGVLTITKATLTVTADSNSKVYGALDPAFTVVYSGFVNNQTLDDITTKPTASPGPNVEDAGSYTITPGGGADESYDFAYVTAPFIITKAVLNATADNKTKPYGTVNPIYTVSYSGFVNGDVLAEIDATRPTANTPPQIDDKTHVGNNYTIGVSGGLDNNYTFNYIPGILTITKATLTATSDAKSKVYGTLNPPLTITYTGLLNDDVPNEIDTPPGISTPAQQYSPAGSYQIDLDNTGSDNNYNIILVENLLTVTKATLIATAVDKTRKYGEPNPLPFTVTYTGFLGSDGPGTGAITTAPTMSTAAGNTSPVTNYAITFNNDGVAPNYNFSYVPGNLSVTKAMLTARPNDASRKYGEANPLLFPVSYTGFANGETELVIATKVNITDSHTSTSSNAGPYSIDAAGANDENYDFTYVPGVLTVTKAPLTLTAAGQSRPYGSANLPLTINYTGFQNGETSDVLDDNPPTNPKPSASTLADETYPVGNHTIAVSGGIDNNYAYTFVAGTLAITKATLTAKADNRTKPFNTPNPNPFTISYTGFLNGDNTTVFNAPNSPPGASTTAAVNAPVGTYTINVTGGSAANYTLAYASGMLTIEKATPVVTWSNPATMTYGPALGATQLNATANVAGTFDYHPAGGTVLNVGANQVLSVDFAPSDPGNYNPVNGTTVIINVIKQTPIITWPNPGAITFGTALSATQLNASSNAPGDLVYDPPLNHVLNAGNHNLTVDFNPSGPNANNYNAVLDVTRVITVNKATPVITWANPAPIPYGTALSSTQQNSTFSVPAQLPEYSPLEGAILPVGANQVIQVTWKPVDQQNYNNVTGQVLITVVKATPVVTWATPADITYGTPLNTTSHLNPVASVAGVFAFNHAPNTVLNAGAYTLTATFTPDDQTRYNVVTGISTTINVLKANPVITWPAPGPITYGTQLTATQYNVSTGVAGAFSYDPPLTRVLDAGANQTLTATFTPAIPANYNTIVTTRTITVNKANPVITWPNPGAITYGTPLTVGVQLNASANVPGQFFYYDPEPNDILNTGVNQVLSVRFEPTDLLNYNIIPTATALITVNKATPVVTFPTPLPIKVGVPLAVGVQLNASANVPGNYTYTPLPGTSFASEGNYTLSVKFEPSDAANYNIVPVTQTQITVSSKDNPVVTWNDPPDITYGTLLTNGVQLNASANVAGQYDYGTLPGKRLNAGAAQVLSVTFTPNDAVNFNSVVKTVHINVNKKVLTATANNASRAYGGANPTFTITYTGFVPGVTDVIDTAPTATSAAIGADPAGSTFDITPSGGVDNNFSFNYVKGTLTITKATLIATAENKTREYGLDNPINTIAYSGFVNTDGPGSIIQPTFNPGPATNATVGNNYTISFLNGGSAANYDITLQTGTLSITKALLVLIGNDLTKPYGDVNPTLTFRYIGLRGIDTEAVVNPKPTITTSAGTMSPIGSYTFTLSGGAATNYTLALFPGSLTITKAPLIAKANNLSRTYGQPNTPNGITYTGFKGTDGPGTITQPDITGPNATSASDAGTYTISLSGGSATNYDLTLQNGALIINKATLTAKAENKSRQYGLDNPASFIITYTGFVNGDDVTDISVPTAAPTIPNRNVGSYVINVSDGSATNYNFSYQSGTLTVDAAPLIARANDRTRMYGQNNPASFAITYTGFLLDDGIGSISPATAGTLATPASPVGTYGITVTGGSATNYTITRQSGTLTIAKATLIAKATDRSKVYGAAVIPNTITYTGLVNGDDPGDIAKITQPTILGNGTTITANSPVGVYDLTLNGGTATNYAFVLQNGAVTITPAALTARAQNDSRPYGGNNPTPFTITYTGFVAGDTPLSITQPAATTTAGPTSPAGPYDITLSGTTSNYTFTFVTGTLTVTKATVNVTADNRTKVYGDNNPDFTLSYSGLRNNENVGVIDTPPKGTTTATSASPFGSYTINVSGGADNNYTFTYAPGTLTVSKAPLTAKADNKQKFYGDTNPPMTITYTGFVNSDGPTSITQPTPSTVATTTSPLGDYPIVLSNGTAVNYTLTLQTGTLSVIPALLTITAVNQSRAYGAVNPPLTLTYSGFTSGQSVADLDLLPQVTTVAAIASNAGTYDIVVSGGFDPNYTFAYTTGTLTVTKASLAAHADPKVTTYGAIPPLTVSYSGFVNGEDASVIDTAPAISTTATATSSPGDYTVTLTGGEDNNYDLVNNDGTMTIGKASLTAKADDKSRITGAANPALTISYSGFMNDETIDVINTLPSATTTATTASSAGSYPIEVSGGLDDNYVFVYQSGALTVVLDNPPVVRNFLVKPDEDKRFNFNVALFAANYTDEPNGKISYIKIISVPQNGALFNGSARVNVGDEVHLTNGELQDFYYLSNSNYTGNDNFGWNLFDGTYLAVSPATVNIQVQPVNDPPVLSNIESGRIFYSLGDPAVPVTEQIIINDVDDNFIFSASVKIATNYTQGDELKVSGGTTNTKIESTYNVSTGELKLKGRESRATYESILTKVVFSSPVTGEATISEKNIIMIVRDSTADSNIATRTVDITEVFPELDIVNSFTPNGDGFNDEWDILNLHSYSNININIYDFNSARVFQCNTNDCRWDGTRNGNALPAGPYSYTIDLNNGKRKYKGIVTILK
ncbi:MAG TPA: MBG domain-containing protein [Cyclobacteriaceae bacterium]|nr:MBG domain-containing protein [Cyclobacteriaceae bacterium]